VPPLVFETLLSTRPLLVCPDSNVLPLYH